MFNFPTSREMRNDEKAISNTKKQERKKKERIRKHRGRQQK